ncbi:MAG: DUF2269 family protein [Candidatus Parabeggiatoa sp.]|nr:DUF2269 family protein [Candidatus Parabeggiatoa sp.]
MYKNIKVLHILGVVLFFGSILGHAVAGIVSSGSTSPELLYIVRQVVEAETIYLTVPGLILFSITGIALIVIGKLPIRKLRWLTAHVAIGVIVILNAILFLAPTGQELLEASQQLASGGTAVSLEQIHALETKEAVFGAINIISCLILVTIAVIKPKWGGRTQ